MTRAVVLPVVASSIVLAVSAVRPSATDGPTPRVPLCPGLTIVTAISHPSGDYESIKTIESVSESSVRLKYSVERVVEDLFSFTADAPKLTKFTLYRTVRRPDLASATLYLQQFSTELPETVPETTAIGTSAAVLAALKSKGESKLGIFIPFSQIKPGIDRNTHPNVYDNQMMATVTRVGGSPVMVPVLLNDAAVTLPTIQARGDFFGDQSEFFFLDDPANPLTLTFRFGIDGIRALNADQAKAMGMKPRPAADKDVLRVVKISHRCGELVTAPTGPSGASGLERSLTESGRADVYSIYFSFNSDVIREESEPALKEIADVLRRHADWKLAVNGHTDDVGADGYNLDLSKRRSDAVKNALVSRHAVAAARLSTSGFGRSQPKDTNDTLEGRARNRRVELVRQ